MFVNILKKTISQYFVRMLAWFRASGYVRWLLGPEVIWITAHLAPVVDYARSAAFDRPLRAEVIKILSRGGAAKIDSELVSLSIFVALFTIFFLRANFAVQMERTDLHFACACACAVSCACVRVRSLTIC